MTPTNYVDLALPERPPAGPRIAGVLMLALALAVGCCYAFACGTRATRPSSSAAAPNTPPAVSSSAQPSQTAQSSTRRDPSRRSPAGEGNVATGTGAPASGGTRGLATTQSSLTTPALVTREQPIEPRLVVRGSGPLETVTRTGEPGLARVTVDSTTGKVVKSVTVRHAISTVAVRTRSSAGKVVALTFDDGPHPTQTPAVLKILAAEKIKATFFMVGAMARYHPAAARAVAAAGMLIGDHTEHHRNLPDVSSAAVTREIELGARSIEAITGVVPHWFRSPYGAASSAGARTASRLGMRLVTWDVDPEDWRSPTPAAIAEYVVSRVQPGSVVLLHDAGGTSRASTIAALPKIVSALKKKGYRFVTLDQL